MYNTDYLEQIEESRRSIFGLGGPNKGAAEAAQRARYSPPPGQTVPCYEDVNGEYVPHTRQTIKVQLRDVLAKIAEDKESRELTANRRAFQQDFEDFVAGRLHAGSSQHK